MGWCIDFSTVVVFSQRQSLIIQLSTCSSKYSFQSLMKKEKKRKSSKENQNDFKRKTTSNTSKIVKLTINEIPKWVKSSDSAIFHELMKNVHNPSELLFIEEKYLFNVEKITSILEFEKALEVIRYWCIEIYPVELYRFALENFLDNENLRKKMKGRFPEFENLIFQFSFLESLSLISEYEIQDPEREFVTLNKKEFQFFGSKKLTLNALLAISSVQNSLRFFNGIMRAFALIGDLEALKFGMQKNWPLNSFIDLYCVTMNHVECLSFLVDNQVTISMASLELSCKFGFLESLEYIINFNDDNSNSEFDFFNYSLENGHLECVRYLLTKDFIFSEASIIKAVKGKHIQCLELLHDVGYNFSSEALEAAVSVSGNFECVRFLIGAGCAMDEFILPIACRRGNLEIVRLLIQAGCPAEDITEEAVKSENIHLLNFLFDLNFEFEESCCVQAIKVNNLNLIQHLVQEFNCELTEYSLNAAAFSGNLSMIKFILNKGVGWSYETTSNAAASGNLECLVYLHEKGCPWNKFTCHSAALNGHLDCLKYAHENGCSWDEETCKYAAREGYLDCLVYAHENHCPWNKFALIEARNNKQMECVQYIQTNDSY